MKKGQKQPASAWQRARFTRFEQQLDALARTLAQLCGEHAETRDRLTIAELRLVKATADRLLEKSRFERQVAHRVAAMVRR